MAYDELDDLEMGRVEETDSEPTFYEGMPTEMTPESDEADQPAFNPEESSDTTDTAL